MFHPILETRFLTFFFIGIELLVVTTFKQRNPKLLLGLDIKSKLSDSVMIALVNSSKYLVTG